MTRSTTKRDTKRSLQRLGRTLTLINQVAETEDGDPKRDDHGNIIWADPTELEIVGELVYRGTPRFARRADGLDIEVDVVGWVEDPGEYGERIYGNGTYGSNATAGEQREDRRATRVADGGGERYVVRDTFVQDDGLIRFHGEKE